MLSSEQFRNGQASANTLSSLPRWAGKPPYGPCPSHLFCSLVPEWDFTSQASTEPPSVSTHLSLDKGFLSSMVSFPNPRVHEAAAPWFSSGRTKFALLLPHFVQFTVPCCRTVLRLLALRLFTSLALLFTNKKPIASCAYGHLLQIL